MGRCSHADQSDNVHTVKRRLQISVNAITDESSLTYGDMVLNNDLDVIQFDSLLPLKKSMHQGSYTPCLSPRGGDLPQKDKSGLIEVLGRPERFLVAKSSGLCTLGFGVILEILGGRM